MPGRPHPKERDNVVKLDARCSQHPGGGRGIRDLRGRCGAGCNRPRDQGSPGCAVRAGGTGRLIGGRTGGSAMDARSCQKATWFAGDMHSIPLDSSDGDQGQPIAACAVPGGRSSGSTRRSGRPSAGARAALPADQRSRIAQIRGAAGMHAEMKAEGVSSRRGCGAADAGAGPGGRDAEEAACTTRRQRSGLPDRDQLRCEAKPNRAAGWLTSRTCLEGFVYRNGAGRSAARW